MKVIISQTVYFDEHNGRFPHSLNKEVESEMMPHVGDSIEDSIWEDGGPYEVIESIINYQENYCYVVVKELDYRIPKGREEEFAHMAELHEWKPLWGKNFLK